MAARQTAYERLIDALRRHGYDVVEKPDGPGARAVCPNHDDHKPSLDIKAAPGKVLIICRVCGSEATPDILAKIGLTKGDLFDNRKGIDHNYGDGLIVSRHYPRGSNDKQIRQRGNKADRTLYGAERIKPDTDLILAVEGESNVDDAALIDEVAVSAKMGAGKADKSDWDACYGHPVWVIADKNAPGRRHAAQVTRILNGHVPELGVFEAADGCHDLSDHIAAGLGLEDLVAIELDDDDEAPEPPPETVAGNGTGDDEVDLEGAIQHRLHILRINAEARRRLDDEQHPQAQPPPVKDLDTLLAEPDTVTRYRIAELAPTDSRIILSAQYKAGKTIIVGNLIRALADGDPFLGRFTTNTTARHIVLIDDELSENTLRHWLRDQRIDNTGAVADVVSLRGRVSAINLLDDRRRAEWAHRLADLGCDYLILDCLRPVLDALGLDERREAGRFLVQFDALLEEAGITDALLVHHMGHANERARGDSRLQDWPDAIWNMVREDHDDPSSPRYFSAVGRDVNVLEGRLAFDETTRRLTYAAGSRSDAKVEAALPAVIQALAEAGEELSGRAVEGAVDPTEHPRACVRAALAMAVSRGLVAARKHGARTKLHRIAHPCSECGLPVTAQGQRHESCPPSVEEGLF